MEGYDIEWKLQMELQKAKSRSNWMTVPWRTELVTEVIMSLAERRCVSPLWTAEDIENEITSFKDLHTDFDDVEWQSSFVRACRKWLRVYPAVVTPNHQPEETELVVLPVQAGIPVDAADQIHPEDDTDEMSLEGDDDLDDLLDVLAAEVGNQGHAHNHPDIEAAAAMVAPNMGAPLPEAANGEQGTAVAPVHPAVPCAVFDPTTYQLGCLHCPWVVTAGAENIPDIIGVGKKTNMNWHVAAVPAMDVLLERFPAEAWPQCLIERDVFEDIRTFIDARKLDQFPTGKGWDTARCNAFSHSFNKLRLIKGSALIGAASQNGPLVLVEGRKPTPGANKIYPTLQNLPPNPDVYYCRAEKLMRLFQRTKPKETAQSAGAGVAPPQGGEQDSELALEEDGEGLELHNLMGDEQEGDLALGGDDEPWELMLGEWEGGREEGKGLAPRELAGAGVRSPKKEHLGGIVMFDAYYKLVNPNITRTGKRKDRPDRGGDHHDGPLGEHGGRGGKRGGGGRDRGGGRGGRGSGGGGKRQKSGEKANTGGGGGAAVAGFKAAVMELAMDRVVGFIRDQQLTDLLSGCAREHLPEWLLFDARVQGALRPAVAAWVSAAVEGASSLSSDVTSLLKASVALHRAVELWSAKCCSHSAPQPAAPTPTDSATPPAAPMTREKTANDGGAKGGSLVEMTSSPSVAASEEVVREMRGAPQHAEALPEAAVVEEQPWRRTAVAVLVVLLALFLHPAAFGTLRRARNHILEQRVPLLVNHAVAPHQGHFNKTLDAQLSLLLKETGNFSARAQSLRDLGEVWYSTDESLLAKVAPVYPHTDWWWAQAHSVVAGLGGTRFSREAKEDLQLQVKVAVVNEIDITVDARARIACVAAGLDVARVIKGLRLDLLRSKVAAAVDRHRVRLVEHVFSDHDCAHFNRTQVWMEAHKHWPGIETALNDTFLAYQSSSVWPEVARAIHFELNSMFEGFCSDSRTTAPTLGSVETPVQQREAPLDSATVLELVGLSVQNAAAALKDQFAAHVTNPFDLRASDFEDALRESATAWTKELLEQHAQHRNVSSLWPSIQWLVGSALRNASQEIRNATAVTEEAIRAREKAAYEENLSSLEAAYSGINFDGQATSVDKILAAALEKVPDNFRSKAVARGVVISPNYHPYMRKLQEKAAALLATAHKMNHDVYASRRKELQATPADQVTLFVSHHINQCSNSHHDSEFNLANLWPAYFGAEVRDNLISVRTRFDGSGGGEGKLQLRADVGEHLVSSGGLDDHKWNGNRVFYNHQTATLRVWLAGGGWGGGVCTNRLTMNGVELKVTPNKLSLPENAVYNQPYKQGAAPVF